MRRLGLAALLATSAAWIVAAPAASALTVGVRKDTLSDRQLHPDDPSATEDFVTVRRLDVTARRRERVSLRVTVSGGDLVFSSRARAIAARGTCRRSGLGAHRVRCPRRGLEINRFRLGDRNDRLTIATGRAPMHRLSASAGAGADTVVGPTGKVGMTLLGGQGQDRLTGSGGRDQIAGGPGPDVVHAREGDDTIVDRSSDGVFSADAYDGGPGRDQVVYLRDRGPGVDATVSLPDRVAGRPGERDTLSSVEGARADSGGDRLFGDGGANTLELPGVIAPGQGTIVGGPGNDMIRVLSGARSIGAGDGDDRLSVNSARSGPETPVTCGPGLDRITQSDARLLLATDCELIELPGEYLGAINEVAHAPDQTHLQGTMTVAPVRISGGTAVFHLVCTFRRAADRCKGQLSVNGATASFDVGPNAQSDIPVTLKPADVTGLGSGVRAVVLVVADGVSDPSDITWSTLLHA